ncbi:MAG: class I SAM-dependent methyltransferase [Flavimaricola sp.]|nr:class I SAM-dependent methyltransferase [Flavimaricola sp.]
MDFFDRSTRQNLRVLDVGCGQGRDAVFIARKGHSVIGVDLSPNGIRDLNKAAKAEQLSIEGVVADISTYTPEGDFDVVLIDRTLHMLPRKERLEALGRLIGFVRPGGWVLIADEPANMQDFKDAFAASDLVWDILLDKGGSLFLQRD